MGSPPHTWRKFDEARIPAQGRRITSTYVEKIDGFRASQGFNKDHLHIRGENS